MKGSRHSAAQRAGQRQAKQNRLSRSSQALKQRPSRRALAQDMQRQAQQASTSRAKAAAEAQRGPAGMQGPKQDSLPFTTAGLQQAQQADTIMDWTAPTGGRGSGGGGGNGLQTAAPEQGFWASLTPFHKALAIAAGGWVAWKLSKRR